MANQFTPRGECFTHSSAFDLILLFVMYSDLLVYHHSTDHKAIFHKNSWTCSSHCGICASFLQPRVCYLPMKRSSDWPMLQQRNEPSPTSVPCAITYSIKFVVSLLVIVMNMQGVNFFCHSLRRMRQWGLTKRASWLDPLLPQGKPVEVNDASKDESVLNETCNWHTMHRWHGSQRNHT